MKASRWSLETGGLALLIVLLLSCGGPAPAPSVPVGGVALTSSAFAAGAEIPRRYSCDGQDISPPLQWSEPPAGTQSFALVMDDPDASGFRHWLIYNIPGTARSLPEAVARDSQLPDGSRQGTTSWGRVGYGGPCPPSGTHRYAFRLYALDVVLDLPAGASLEQLNRAMQGHILAQAELIATYTRSP